MNSGKIIVLNGTSSSGKSSIAKELQAVLSEPYLHLGIDTFIAMLPSRYFGEQPPADEGFWLVKGQSETHIRTGPVGHRLVRGMYRSLAVLAATGNNLIVDHVVLDRQGLADLVEAVGEFPVLFVGVRCPLEVLIQRERGRTDRVVGMAQAQYPLVHRDCIYDLEIDTSVDGPAEAALPIKRRQENGPPPTACEKMRQVLGIG